MMDHDPQHLIDAYLDETLTPEQGGALNAWVKQSPDNARQFARATWLHRQVYDRLHVEDLRQMQDAHEEAEQIDYGQVLEQLAELEASADDSGMVDLTEEMNRREQERKRKAARQAAAERAARDAAAPPEVARVIVIPKMLVYGVAAMVALGLLTALYAGWMTGKRNTSAPVVLNPEAGTLTQAQSLPPVVAELVRGEGLVWGDGALSSQPGTELRKGGLVLERGIAEVRFQSGAVATFRGPAVIDLRGDNRMALTEGAMVANVPEQAYGFTVDTPTMRVVDFGTEFGVTADPLGDSTVQVFVGEVSASVFDAAGQPGTAASLNSRDGMAVSNATRAARTLEVDGRAFEDLAPHVALLFRNLVVNGDFEQGPVSRITGSTFPDVQNVRVYGWDDQGPGSVLDYHQAARHDYPDPAMHTVPDDRGERYYACMGVGTIRQQIDLAPLAALVDGGAVRFDLSAWLGGYGQQEEYLVLSARFLDADGRPLGEPTQLQPVNVDDRGRSSGFVQRAIDGAVPPGARRVEITIQDFGFNLPPEVRDGYADNVVLVLSVD